MIRFRLKELIAEKEFREGRRVNLAEIAHEANIHRSTLSKMLNQRGYNTGTENLDKLCKFFGCEIQDLAEYIEEIPEE